jgi:hypothetical protein
VIPEERVRGLIAGLVIEGVDPEAIQAAVSYAVDLRPGQLISPGPLVRAFTHEQVGRLERRSAPALPTDSMGP